MDMYTTNKYASHEAAIASKPAPTGIGVPRDCVKNLF